MGARSTLIQLVVTFQKKTLKDIILQEFQHIIRIFIMWETKNNLYPNIALYEMFNLELLRKKNTTKNRDTEHQTVLLRTLVQREPISP